MSCGLVSVFTCQIYWRLLKMSSGRLITFMFAILLVCPNAFGQVKNANDDLEINGESRDLVVLLHGFAADSNGFEDVRNVLKDNPQLANSEGFQHADIFAPDLPFGMYSVATPADVVAKLLTRIDEIWAERIARGEPYRRIVFVGHSMGALFARKLYIVANGENPEARFEPELKEALSNLGATPPDMPREWAQNVDRIILLAGMNRGWSINHHMSLWRATEMRIGVGLGHAISWFRGRFPIIFSIRRGSPFITQLRIQWLAMLAHSDEKLTGDALTVQLLGSIDDLVSPDDNIDLVTGDQFVYLDVPGSGHLSVIQMTDTPLGRGRASVFLTALGEEPEKLIKMQVFQAQIPTPKGPKVTDVVFVIHGIRDEGYWTQKIARRVIAKGKDIGRNVVSETSSYGYFPMLSFLSPGARQSKVEWLMDRYTQAKATYPDAKFSFVGHSNGTYLLAKALSDYPAVRFENIVFAGSVVHRDYEWSQYIPDQAKAVLNFVATSDWVVAFFPNALQALSVQDLGSAGHDGFEIAARHPQVYELDRQYVTGGHGAALDETTWDSIADFVLNGEFRPPPEATLSSEQASWVYYPAKVAPLVWILGAAVLLFVLWFILRMKAAQWSKTLMVVIYFWAIWAVITKV